MWGSIRCGDYEAMKAIKCSDELLGLLGRQYCLNVRGLKKDTVSQASSALSFYFHIYKFIQQHIDCLVVLFNVNVLCIC